jgi:hypothetical protein
MPAVSYFLRLGSESGGDGGDEAIPAVGFLAQSRSPRGSKFVKLRAAVVVGGAPGCFEKILPDQPKQSGIESTLFDEQGLAGNLPNAQKNAVAMKRAERDGLQDEEIQGAGKKLSFDGHIPS